ncbi:helix-turn-helix domain-containing protein [Arthrobacter ginkgonis]|uniref:Helix-turn-helix domain-containing protein n=1 Tax=Arthrobacter ginkgonis TaxID=1630594 RepID=A0ABP7C2N3_9MICC
MTSTPAPPASAFTVSGCAELLTSSLVTVLGSEKQLARIVRGVTLHDPLAPHAEVGGHLVLGIGLDPHSPEFPSSVSAFALNGAAAVIVKARDSRDAFVTHELAEAGCAIIVIRPDADWALIASVARSVAESRPTASASGVPIGDLFGLANALASLAGGAVSLVDYVGRVVGYSTLPEQPIDEMRRQSTLALQEPVPPAASPSYAALYRSAGAVFIPGSEGKYGRVAVAIRANGEALGAIWVIQVDPGGAEQTLALLDSVEPLVALHMSHARRAIAGSEQRSTDLLRTLFEDQGHAHLAATQLGLLPECSHFVVAFGLRDDANRTLGGGQQRLLHLIRTHAHLRFPWAQTALLGPAVVALVASDSAPAVREFAERTVRVSEQGPEHLACAGIGGSAATIAEIGRSYREAMQATGALLSPMGSRASTSGGHIAAFDEVRVELGLARLGELLSEQGLDSGDDVARLLAHDREYGGSFALTLLTLLNRQGSVSETAAELHVHQNTVRYRIERAKKELGIDLSDASARLWLWLRLATARQP